MDLSPFPLPLFPSDEETGEFLWEPPSDNFRGIVTLEYTVEHTDYYDIFGGNERLTSNAGVITLIVGPYYKMNVHTDVPEEIEDESPGKRIVWNRDDDNLNGVEDYLELDGPVAGEDDLVELTIDPYIREDLKKKDFFISFLGGTRAWTTPDKAKEIVYGDWMSWDAVTDLGSIWLEGVSEYADAPGLYINDANDGSYTTPDPTMWPDPIIYDGVVEVALQVDTVAITQIDVSLDLDIDSDNDNGTALPDGSNWEEQLEDHKYGIGKLVEVNYGAADPADNAPEFTPMVVRLPGNLENPEDIRLRFDFDVPSNAGIIKIWTVPKSIADVFEHTELEEVSRVYSGEVYALTHFNLDASSGELVVYIAGVTEGATPTLALVEKYGKPTAMIEATVLWQDGATLHDIGSDEVQYIVVQKDSFYTLLQTKYDVDTGLLSRGVYDRGKGGGDMPQFGQELLSPEQMSDLDIPSDIIALLGPPNPVTGFKAGLYRDYLHGPESYRVAFAGTDAEWSDIATDYLQGTGRYTSQYQDAMKIGFSLGNNPKVNLSLLAVGHSLGGGLASAAGVVGDIHWRTYNAAGLDWSTLINQATGAEYYPGSLYAYDHAATGNIAAHSDWDALTLFQTWTPAFDALGTPRSYDSPYDFEASTSMVAGIAIAAASGGWLGVLGIIGAAVVPGLSHRMNVVMWGILQEDGVNASGYEIGLPGGL